MIHINADNVNDALPEGCRQLNAKAPIVDTRNGKAKVYRGPFATTFHRPWERVLFDPRRDANPFFHLMEALWMFAGREDVAFPARFNSKISQYSDDGLIFHGAYGHRWRHLFGVDQIRRVAQLLQKDPNDRRAVISMWDPGLDQAQALIGGKDVPCNLAISFHVSQTNELDMTVFNRSNDLIWGAYGANAVHFSVLQELLAMELKMEMGQYHQISANTHIYEQHWGLATQLADETWPADIVDPGDSLNYDQVEPVQLLLEHEPLWKFQADCVTLCETMGQEVVDWKTVFFNQVVAPMLDAWSFFEQRSNPDRIKMAQEALEDDLALDWTAIAHDWLGRRSKS